MSKAFPTLLTGSDCYAAGRVNSTGATSPVSERPHLIDSKHFAPCRFFTSTSPPPTTNTLANAASNYLTRRITIANSKTIWGTRIVQAAVVGDRSPTA